MSIAALGVALACCHCTELPTEAGDHVSYHWDDSEVRLCGGTVPTVDRFLETVGGYYGWAPDELGPGVEYFWDEELAVNACSWFGSFSCQISNMNRPTVLSDDPINTHELAHASRGGHGPKLLGYPAFINEAFASRWSSAVIEYGQPFLTSPEFLSAAELRAALEVTNPNKLDYGLAFTWWVALESTYGPTKMAEFIVELDGVTSATGVERATRRAFGISLAESAALAESLPLASVDDPACELDGLPTFTWTGRPLVVERSDAHCDDGDIMNMDGSGGAGWLFALELPDTRTDYYVSLTLPPGVDPVTKGMYLVECHGEPEFGNPFPYNAASVKNGGTSGMLRWPWRLRGRQVGRLSTDMNPDGAVVLPRVVFERVLTDADRPMPP
ncbi:hypothetical protein ENSA5_47520 [Enhygromyxa salina]|uniref:Uncharacterized protein n=1 Tax=Enhygromyxa salina TaxID=215803 RepID=A0A2S9XIV7_9BACT|nr:hypothetical protein [Enhygromyxa salina]PRP92782.1 hypothetical protein ENSA5_47520 [Enhygromyxa salina]